MVQFCPRCGAKEPDDQAVFCQKCGSRLPPVVPEKKERICPTCGTMTADMQAVFCNRCGSPLDAVPPVPARHAAARPEAARPVEIRERCPSCGAPRVDELSDFCNVCGGFLRRPAPPVHAAEPYMPPPAKAAAPPVTSRERCPSCGAPLVDETSDYCNTCGYRRRAAPPVAIPEHLPPYPEETGAAEPYTPLPVADSAGEGGGPPAGRKGRMPLLKWGLAAVAVIIVLLVIGASITGMVPGFNRTANATAAPNDQAPVTTPAATTQAATPAPAPSPAATTMTPVPATTVTADATPEVTAAVSVTAPANVTAAVTVSLPVADESRPVSIGESAYDGKGNLTVNDISWKDKMSDPVPSYAIGKKYLIVNITYENLQKDGSVDADLSRMVLKDGGGYPYEPASDAILENVWTGTSIGPGEMRTGNLLFIVPPGATYLKLYYTFGTGKTAAFTLT